MKFEETLGNTFLKNRFRYNTDSFLIFSFYTNKNILEILPVAGNFVSRQCQFTAAPTVLKSTAVADNLLYVTWRQNCQLQVIF